ncbi:hypothetical protein POM88_027783 [Heracleum sosnowskyi]|uniref:Uncharacterized protein n=1 Tax=Heracleum sosnowskyi TaxID=360622 RepID=A0AAD8I8G2_9APIA|nr:hypothetical protein POM88_027783 [Heracleum sosnowskyi]
MAKDYDSLKKLGEQLREVGNELSQFPTLVDELLSLLDKVWSLLMEVEQMPPMLIQNAYSQCMKGLVAEPLLRHTDADVQVAVASCLSEVMRITEPEAPYSDHQLKEVFQLIVSSFENLSDTSSRSYDKRASILEVAANVRSGVLMLDVECDAWGSEIFAYVTFFLQQLTNCFTDIFTDFHPEKIFTSMESIMTVILEENDAVSLELLIPILATLKINEEISTSARKLGESVLAKCAVKLQPYLKHAVKLLGLSLDGYCEIVATICSERNGDIEHNGDNVSLLKEKPEAAELVSKPFGHDYEIVTIDKNDQSAEDFCKRNFGQISEKDGASESVSNLFRHDDEIFAIDEIGRAADNFCIRDFTQIFEEQEATGLVSKLIGHDDEIVAKDKHDRTADDFCILNLGQIYEKQEAAGLGSIPFGHNDKIIPMVKNDRAAVDLCIWNFRQTSEKQEAEDLEKQEAVFGHGDEIVTFDEDGPAADDFCVLNFAPISEKQEASGLVSKLFGHNDEIEEPEAAELVSKPFGHDDEIVAVDENDRASEGTTTMAVLRRTLVLTAEDSQTQIDNTAFGENALVSGKKSRSQSQTTTSKWGTKSKSDDEQSQTTTIGILAGAADETAMSASNRRRDFTTEDIQTLVDDTASSDNAPASGTKSQSQPKTTTSKRTTKSKNDDVSSTLEETIGILAGALKDMVDNKKLPIPVDELWGFIHEMKLDEDLAGDAFVFLLERPLQLKGLISTPTGIRKSILQKMRK